MRLSRLLQGLSDAEPAISAPAADPEITSITADSREVRPGSLFVAVPGFVSDGHAFIAKALEAGAAAVLVQRDHLAAGLPSSIPLPPFPGPHPNPSPTVREGDRGKGGGATVGDVLVAVDDTRSALSAAATAFHGYPGRQLRVIGITGTDGKTTTSYLINAVLEGAARSTGLFGTVEYKVGPRWLSNPSRLTTPGAPEVQALLAEMVEAGVDYAIVESTSHGLELHRLDHCDYDVGVFTNLSPDHLDLHGTVEAYRAAKGRLFDMLDLATEKHGRRYAVLNADDPASEYMRGRTRVSTITYGVCDGATVRATTVEARPNGTGVQVDSPAGSCTLDLQMPGLFNVSNALAAVCVGLGEGLELGQIAAALTRFAGVPGRMERIEMGQPFTVIVDYAHTGDALRKVLKSLRPSVGGRMIVVFGSAGERGHTRRSGMGEAAAELADYSILTDEDPRSEDPELIIEEIAAAMRSRGRSEPADFVCILDRERAIDQAIGMAGPGDFILLAGKGHESSIEVRGENRPWDDRAAARRALSENGYNSQN
ncbi:MAG: UDP-N-acetylmuramoyl-L-alanyl-D-glutamate--2,6-diaminopimelate ligase [Dehalococcoidia bacterium]